MRKKILFLIMLLVPFLVFAKEEVSYEWDYASEKGAEFIAEKDDEYLVLENVMLKASPKISYFSPAGRKLRSVSFDDMTEEQLSAFGELYRQKRLESVLYYAVGEEYVEIDPNYWEVLICESEEAFHSDTGCEWVDYEELSEEQITKYVGDYKFMYELVDRYPSYYFHFKKVGNIFITQKTSRNEPSDPVWEVYDKDGKKIVSKAGEMAYKGSYIDVNLNGIYFLDIELDYDEQEASYTLTKYDLTGKVEYTIDAGKLITDNTDYDLYYNVPYQIAVVNGGLIVNLGPNYYAEELDACVDYINNGGNPIEPGTRKDADTIDDPYEFCAGVVLGGDLDSIIPGDILLESTEGTRLLKTTKSIKPAEPNKEVMDYEFPTILIKLKFDYEIATKVQGRGSIKAISRGVGGEGVTFVVEPEKGYVLSSVKVSDAYGNVLTFTDYTFTMPSADVLIEATFVKENPNTADIAILSVIILAIVFGIILLNVNKKYRWLK